MANWERHRRSNRSRGFSVKEEQINMKILGLDYGTRRVGVALSYGDSLAQPEVVLANDERLIIKLATIIEEHKVAKIVLGQTDGAMKNKTTAFANQLRDQFKLEVVIIDEAFSSTEAKEKISWRTNAKQPKFIDDKAAAIILQNYLDSQP